MKRRTAELMDEHDGFTSDAIERDNIVGCMSGGVKAGEDDQPGAVVQRRLIILDEPTTGLFPVRRRRAGLHRRIKQEGRA